MPYQYNIPQSGYEPLRYAPQMPLAQTSTPMQGVSNTFLPNNQMAPMNTFGVTPPNPQYTMESKRQFGNIDYNHIAASQTLQGVGAYLRQNKLQSEAKDYQRIQNNPLSQIPQNPNTSQQSLYGMNQFKKGGKVMAGGGTADFDDFDEEDFQDLKDQMDKYFSQKGEQAPEEQKVDTEDKDQVADAQDTEQDQPMSHEAINFLNSNQPQPFDTSDDDDQTGQYITAPSLSANVHGSSMPDMSDHPLLQQFKNGIAKVENAGYQEGNKNSSAFGKYQFTNGTLEAVREMQFKDIPKKDFQEAYKSDPKFQERVMDAYGTHLLSKFPDPHQAATAFFLGEGKANFYNQPDYRPTPNNLTVGSYLKNFDSGYKRQGGHIMNSPGSVDLPIEPGMKMAEGGDPSQPPKKATTADSLALYNNTLQVKDFYSGANGYHQVGDPIPYSASTMFRQNENAVKMMQDNGYNTYEPNTTTQTKISPEQYRKNIDNNRYYQRERQYTQLNLSAPMSLFDKRISPQFSTDYSNSSTGDVATVNQYDPIAVKPWNMLTPKERQERVSKYGDPTRKVEGLGNDPNNWRTITNDNWHNVKVNYQEIPSNAKRSQVQGVQSNQYTPNVTGGSMNPQAPINPTSNFSFSGRDDNGQQTTRYFSDLDNWTNATNQMGYRQREVTNNGKQASATGYQFKEGGTYELTNGQIAQLKKQGYDIEILK